MRGREYEETARNFERQELEAQKKEFIKGCYDAYDLLTSQGAKALDDGNLPNIANAINRMLAYFLLEEDYERCNFLKRFINEHMPDFKVEPDINVEKELLK